MGWSIWAFWGVRHPIRIRRRGGGARESPLFKALCTSGLKESQTRQIELPEDAPVVIGHLIDFLEKGHYLPMAAVALSQSTWDEPSADQLARFNGHGDTVSQLDTRRYVSG